MEKNILREMLVQKNKGLFSPADLFNGIGKGKKEKEIHQLISDGYIDEVVQEKQYKTSELTTGTRKITFYRLSRQGRVAISWLPLRIWFSIKSEIRNILVSSITAIVTTLITIFLTNWIKH